MSMNQVEVVNRWVRGEKGKAGTLHTFEGKLYSYNLLIAVTKITKATKVTKAGRYRIVYDYAGQVSCTTTRHVNLAKRLADEVVPKEFPK